MRLKNSESSFAVERDSGEIFAEQTYTIELPATSADAQIFISEVQDSRDYAEDNVTGIYDVHEFPESFYARFVDAFSDGNEIPVPALEFSDDSEHPLSMEWLERVFVTLEKRETPRDSVMHMEFHYMYDGMPAELPSCERMCELGFDKDDEGRFFDHRNVEDNEEYPVAPSLEHDDEGGVAQDGGDKKECPVEGCDSMVTEEELYSHCIDAHGWWDEEFEEVFV